MRKLYFCNPCEWAEAEIAHTDEKDADAGGNTVVCIRCPTDERCGCSTSSHCRNHKAWDEISLFGAHLHCLWVDNREDTRAKESHCSDFMAKRMMNGPLNEDSALTTWPDVTADVIWRSSVMIFFRSEFCDTCSMALPVLDDLIFQLQLGFYEWVDI